MSYAARKLVSDTHRSYLLRGRKGVSARAKAEARCIKSTGNNEVFNEGSVNVGKDLVQSTADRLN